MLAGWGVMDGTRNQLRGWKEIAGHLHASERTAMRWESTRGLPVRRVPGKTKDAVFANRQELDAWMQRPGNGALEAPEAETAPSPAARWRSRRVLLAVIQLAVTAALLVVVAFTLRALVAGKDEGASAATAAEPQTLEPTAHGAGSASVPKPPDPIVLALTFPGRATSKFGVADGKCSLHEFASGNQVEFCPRAVGGRLAVTVTLLLTDAAMASPAQPSSATYGLEPNARISVYEPVPIDIEWVAGAAPPQGTRPSGR